MNWKTSAILEMIDGIYEDPRLRELSDRDLLQRFHTSRDEAAFHTLLRRHGPMALGVCRAVLGDGTDAEDAFQAAFLVLACKSGSIRRATSLGSWLHGVARRTALKARAKSALRRRHESLAPVAEDSRQCDANLTELRDALHEELERIPERYRGPLVLCYLEGETQSRAAKLLGLSERTVRERLERGRKLLRARLVGRGVAPMETGEASMDATRPSSTLVCGIVQAATLVAAGQGLSGAGVSAPIIGLVNEVLKTMVLTKVKYSLAVLACGAAFAGVVALQAGGPAKVMPGLAPGGGSGAGGNAARVGAFGQGSTGPVRVMPGLGPGIGFGVGGNAMPMGGSQSNGGGLRRAMPGLGPASGFGNGGNATPMQSFQSGAGYPRRTMPGAGPGSGFGFGGNAMPYSP